MEDQEQFLEEIILLSSSNFDFLFVFCSLWDGMRWIFPIPLFGCGGGWFFGLG
jgi:hypothetical protein